MPAALLLLAIFGAKVNFVRQVQPILETRCVRCHGSENAMRGLRVDTKRRAMMAITPGRPDDSRIYNAVKSGFMPPGGPKLSDAEIETLRRWIQEGARWPRKVELKRR